MNWIDTLFTIPSDLQATVVVTLLCSLGLLMGRVRICGVSLGVAWVFFVGILAGHLGFAINADVSGYVQTFGLALFVYALGLTVGPNFFGSLRDEGLGLNAWSLAVVALGTAMAVALCPLMGINMSDMVGVLCGATTNTPALGAAQQALAHGGHSGAGAALACAVTYPLGVVGVILVLMLLKRWLVKPDDLVPKHADQGDHTCIAQYRVANPALAGKTLAQIATMAHVKFIISRLWREGKVIVPKGDTALCAGDDLLVVSNKDEADAVLLLFGERAEADWNNRQIDWNAIDAKVESRTVVVTRPNINGKRLGSLQLHKTYGVNVSRVRRGDIKLLATESLRLQYGDRLIVVGKPDDVAHVAQYFGNSARTLDEPNIGSIFLGLVVGLALGSVPFMLPGMGAPLHLGIAGGAIVAGICVGAAGGRLHIISYTTHSASLMLRRMGLSLYLACLGLDAGKDLAATLMRPEGLLWIGAGIALTVVPVLIVGAVAVCTRRYDYGTLCGVLAGSMANPMALGYAADTLKNEQPSIGYAAVYPIGLFLRVIIAQLLILFFV